LHLGSIGVDGSGRVRLSPWPLADPASVGDDSPTPANDLELVASVLEYGARFTGSAATSSVGILAAHLRRLAGDGAQLSTAQLLEALAALEPSERDKTTGQVPVTQVSANAMRFSANSPPHIYRRRRRRSRWPVAAGGVLSILVLLVLLGPGSQTALPSASGARPTTVTCSSRPKACPTNARSKAPRSTVTAPVPYVLAVPVKPPGTSAAVNVVSPVAATYATTTTTPPPTTTTTTTTTPPPTTTTTTTTTPPPTTTTTTVASSAGSTGP